MSEYKDPIRISPDDPICSATAMNGTIVGVLFEKTGAEIKEATAKRIQAVDAKIAEYRMAVKDVDEFLKDKEKQIEDINKLYTKRGDEKTAKMKPFERKIDEIRKRMADIRFTFDKETEKQVAERAVGFQEGFQELETRFDGIDDLIEREEMADRALRGRSKSSAFRSVITDGLSGVLGETGVQGTSDRGFSGSHNYYVSEAEDSALSKLETLKAAVREYREKVKMILNFIWMLQEEKRRLELIRRHLKDEFNYKLDLNKLSAFGFEQVEVAV